MRLADSHEFQFLASLQFTTKRVPEPRDKFAILQVPCMSLTSFHYLSCHPFAESRCPGYTEGEESLRKTIESLAKLKYDDKRKLLFIICDVRFALLFSLRGAFIELH